MSIFQLKITYHTKNQEDLTCNKIRCEHQDGRDVEPNKLSDKGFKVAITKNASMGK